MHDKGKTSWKLFRIFESFLEAWFSLIRTTNKVYPAALEPSQHLLDFSVLYHHIFFISWLYLTNINTALYNLRPTYWKNITLLSQYDFTQSLIITVFFIFYYQYTNSVKKGIILQNYFTNKNENILKVIIFLEFVLI